MHVTCIRCGLDKHRPLSQEIAFHGFDELVWTVAEAVAHDYPRWGRVAALRDVRHPLPEPEPVYVMT